MKTHQIITECDKLPKKGNDIFKVDDLPPNKVKAVTKMLRLRGYSTFTTFGFLLVAREG